jgi:hypothetical protein
VHALCKEVKAQRRGGQAKWEAALKVDSFFPSRAE